MNFPVFMINGLLWQVAGTCTLIHFPCIKAHVPMGTKIVSRNNMAEIRYLSHPSIFRLVLQTTRFWIQMLSTDCVSLKQKLTHSGFNSDRGR